MLRVAPKDPVQVPSAEHEREIQDLVANGANDPLSKVVVGADRAECTKPVPDGLLLACDALDTGPDAAHAVATAYDLVRLLMDWAA